MGNTHVTIKVENFRDWARANESKSQRRPKIRSVVISDALVDTETTYLGLPSRYIKELGLTPYPKRITVMTAVGPAERRMFGGALLTIDDRTDEFAVVELPDEAPALIGVVPLEVLDYTVDPTTQSLIGKHGKNRVALMYRERVRTGKRQT